MAVKIFVQGHHSVDPRHRPMECSSRSLGRDAVSNTATSPSDFEPSDSSGSWYGTPLALWTYIRRRGGLVDCVRILVGWRNLPWGLTANGWRGVPFDGDVAADLDTRGKVLLDLEEVLGIGGDRR